MQLDENAFAKRHYKGEYRDIRDDCIRRIDAIQALKEAGKWAQNGGFVNPCEVIENIPAADVGPKWKWIPVTERLPECEVGAEIRNVEWISHDMVFAGCFGRGGKYRDAYFRTWTDTTEGIDAKDADCWRVVTLPEPPKEEA